MNLLTSKRGDAVILIALTLSVTGLLVAAGMQALSVSKIHSYSRQYNEEAGFYGGEIAATSGFLVNRGVASPPVGEFDVAITIEDPADPPGSPPKKYQSLKELFINILRILAGIGGGPPPAAADSPPGTPVTVTVTAVKDTVGAGDLMIEKYTGDNLTYRYAVEAGGEKKHCGKMVFAGNQITETCLVTAGSGCVIDPLNMEIKVFGINNEGKPSPFTLSNQVGNMIALRGLAYTGFQMGMPIRRTNTSSGGGFVWSNHGTLHLAELGEICGILGYRDYITSTCKDEQRGGVYPTGKCNWHTPADNQLQFLNTATDAFEVQGGNVKYEREWASSITCRGRMICP